MNKVKFLFVALVATMLLSCNKDESASLTLERTSLYFSSWEDSSAQTISYVASNAKSVGVGSISEGWTAVVNEASRTITVWPVVVTNKDGVINEDLLKEGSMVVNALNKEGTAKSYYVNLYIAESEDIDTAGKANCYVICKPSLNYTFDASVRPDGEPLATVNVELLWQSNPDVVKHVEFVDGKAMFYIAPSYDDAERVENTNAVIAAYNHSGEVIWSWHLWITNENPLTATDRYSNGKTFMRNNLGAFTNSNGESNEQKILDSHGLYYQWGRKDPFSRPYFHDAAGAEIEDKYNESGTYIAEEMVEIYTNVGTLDYITKYPMRFITNASCIEEGGDRIGDWLITASPTLWNNDGAKSLYDPCPHGWRVPTAEEFAVLTLSDSEDAMDHSTARKRFGWHLSDGSNNYFYPACGRRRYTDGKIENMSYKEGVYPAQPEPWEGYYWTSTTTNDGKAVSLYFDLTTPSRAVNNKFDIAHPACKANGLQVRCVKE